MRTLGTVSRPAAPGRDGPTGKSLWIRHGTWWLHPAWTGVLVALPCLAVTWYIPDQDYRLWWRTPKYFDSAACLTTLLLLGAFVVGAIAPSLARRRSIVRGSRVTPTADQQRILAQAGRVFVVLTLIGYAVWALLAISRGYGGDQLGSALLLDRDTLIGAKEEYFSTAPGVTTLTQFGPLAIVCLLLDRRISGHRHRWALALLATLVLARVLINAERLALFEAVVPLIVVAAALRSGRSARPRHRLWWALLPMVAPLLLAVVFGLFEYTRSWSDRYQHEHIGVGEFVMLRLGGYYATASNNSAVLLTHLAPYAKLPCFTIPVIWNFPILKSLFNVHGALDAGPHHWMLVLAQYGNPEFNNQGAILPAVADYGPVGALVWWAVIGLLLGVCYRALRAGELHGLVLYAVLYVGLLEMGRIFYWGLGRAFPVITGGILLAVLLRRAGLRAAGDGT
ncbi:O-antigen polymerase [Actinoallomurus sp. NPDC052308]|uniref:O-antigen polymerase n=1 Tax=Actinoallomurus sp. NPDC052308 TaxID=3155530 RepID=UPI00343F6FAB